MAEDKTEAAARELGYNTAGDGSIMGAFGSTWDTWLDHVKSNAVLPGDEGEGEPPVIAVPLLVYGDTAHDYISTDVDAGQVMIRDGNDPSGKAWKFSAKSFERFVRVARGEDVEDGKGGDNPIVAAAKLAKRTEAKVKADEAVADGTPREEADEQARKDIAAANKTEAKATKATAAKTSTTSTSTK